MSASCTALHPGRTLQRSHHTPRGGGPCTAKLILLWWQSMKSSLFNELHPDCVASALCRGSSFKFPGSSRHIVTCVSDNECLRAGRVQWLERRTRDRKFAGSSPGRSGGRIFFSGVNFLCRLLFRYPFHPRVTSVARKRFRSFCQTCR